jgi:hypothetical protein
VTIFNTMIIIVIIILINTIIIIIIIMFVFVQKERLIRIMLLELSACLERGHGVVECCHCVMLSQCDPILYRCSGMP